MKKNPKLLCRKYFKKIHVLKIYMTNSQNVFECEIPYGSACLPVVHRWEGHRAAIQGLTGWRWQWDVLVVSATQRSALIGHHSSASAIMLTSTSGTVACSHLSSEDTGWRARIGVGVARMVHRVRVVMQIRTVTPTRDTESQIIRGEVPCFKLRTYVQLLKE